MDVASTALELYGLPPEDFTAARKKLAQQAKDAGDGSDSAAVKALRNRRSRPGSRTCSSDPTRTPSTT
ncbi:hypothetical protein OG809_17225 [Kribbella soli]